MIIDKEEEQFEKKKNVIEHRKQAYRSESYFRII